MDPCPFVRVLVGNLALKLPPVARAAGAAGVHPSSTPCYCRIRLNNLPPVTASLPVLLPSDAASGGAESSPANSIAAVFHLSKDDLERLLAKRSFIFFAAKSSAQLKIAIYSGRRGTTCGLQSGRILGRVTLDLDFSCNGGIIAKPVVFHSGLFSVSEPGGIQLNVTVRAEPDPRFVFEFDGEPERSPQVLQIQGAMRQPMFTVQFCCRNASETHLRSRSMQSEVTGGTSRSWLPSFGSERERSGRERKGWSVTVHDLSGSPVALASMVMPFVASPGTDKVSKSNPGAWLILRPGDGTWKPWGRLEAWRERNGTTGGGDGIGLRFELLLPDRSTGTGISIAESTISVSNGGKFTIDLTGAAGALGSGTLVSPGCSPRGSGELGFYGLWPVAVLTGGGAGFVMSAAVEGEGRTSRPTVEVGVQHVGCAEDAAAFVAIAAAVDLSLDACRLFSQKLRKELTHSDTLR